MIYKVLDTLQVGINTSVTIDGDGGGLKNNMIFADENGAEHELLSVALLSGQQVGDTPKTTTLLVKGKFKAENIIIN